MWIGILISIVTLSIPVFIACKISTSRYTALIYPSVPTFENLDRMRSEIARGANGKSYINIGGMKVELGKETGRPLCG